MLAVVNSELEDSYILDREKSMAKTDNYNRAGNVEDRVQFGNRIRGLREQKDMSQQSLAKLIGIGRSTVAQWENGSSTPTIHTAKELAGLLNTTPEYLSFAKGDATSQNSTHISINEYVYDTLDKPTVGEKWTIPKSWLDEELHISDERKLGLVKVTSDQMSPDLEPGDMVIVDMNDRQPSPPGTFVHWDGVGMVINAMQVTPAANAKQGPSVSCMDGNRNEVYSVPLKKMAIIGRVKGTIRAA